MNYVPVSAERNYGYCASEEEWMDRHEVWHFKDGNCSPIILQGLAEEIRELKTTNCVVCFIPASTSMKTVTRYGDVSRRLQEMTGVPCSYTAISKENDNEPVTSPARKQIPPRTSPSTPAISLARPLSLLTMSSPAVALLRAQHAACSPVAPVMLLRS